MPAAVITAVAGHLPERVQDNAELAREWPDWSVEKIAGKTGIHARHLAAEGECASDLAVRAAEKLFAAGAARREEIDWLILVTQSPDHFLPTTACLIQQRLGLPTTCAAIDVNQGCSGFIYGCGLARGLIESGQARCVLLLTADTYTRYLDPADRSVRTLFGDGAAASLLRADGPGGRIGDLVYGSDGSGAGNLVVDQGGNRHPGGRPLLRMDGPEVFAFASRTVPPNLQALLAKRGWKQEEVDLFLLHQANKHMLDHIRRKIGIPETRLPLRLADCGNTVSSTIPLVLEDLLAKDALRPGMKLVMIGFGVGYSWGAATVEWA